MDEDNWLGMQLTDEGKIWFVVLIIIILVVIIWLIRKL
jgi:hypothetical protein